MWVETFPHRELVNLATARAIYVDVDQREGFWFVAADLSGSHRTLVDGLESRQSALEILRALADEVIRLLAPVVRLEQRLHLSSTTPSARARSRAGDRPGGSEKRASARATTAADVSANGKVLSSERMVSAAPIVELLGSSRRSVRAIAREAEAVVGASPKAMERLIHRLRRGEQTKVRLEVADRLAIALGQDAATIWPGEW